MSALESDAGVAVHRLLPILLAMTLFTACSGSAWDAGDSVPESESSKASRSRHPGQPTLRLGVSAMLSPIATYEKYSILFRELSQALGSPYRFVQRRTYQEMNKLLLEGELDMAFICSGAYAALPANAPVELLAVPELAERTTYRALILVRADSRYQKLEDLEGGRFAFTDPLSNSGYYFPASRVSALGQTPESFFRSTTFTGGHDRSVQALRRGLVDGAAIFDIGWARLLAPRTPEDPPLRTIDTSPPYPAPPVVAPTTIPAALRTKMRAFLLGLSDSARGRRRLERLGMKRFREPQVVYYDEVRKLRQVARATYR